MRTYKLKSHLVFASILLLLTALLGVSFIFALGFGAMKVSLSDTYKIVLHQILGLRFQGLTELIESPALQVIWQIRFPRVILGAAAGGGLALCGVVMQAVVQNPLAEPYILGISSGASVGATFSIFMGSFAISLFTTQSIAILAFTGAIGASAAVLTLASTGGGMSSSKLVLSGMVVNALCTALSNFVISLAGDTSGLMSIRFWTLGSLTRATWGNILLPVCAVTLCAIFFLLQYRPLNTMLLGDEAAVTLGIPLGFYRKLYITICAMLTGILVSCCGVIGFVGLMLPHIARALVGSDHRRLLPVSILAGAIFLLWSDVFARTLIQNAELSIGIITSLSGAPFFAYILLKRNYHFG